MKIIITRAEFNAATATMDAHASFVQKICDLLKLKNTVSEETVSWGVFCALLQERLGEKNVEVFEGQILVNLPEELTCGLLSRMSTIFEQLQATLPAVAGVFLMVDGILKAYDLSCNSLVNKIFPGKRL